MVTVRLAKFDCIEAAVVLHPGPITVEQINEVKTPISVLGAEFDHLAPPELLKELGDILSAKPEVDSFVKIFPGVGHGWTVRYNDDDEFAVKSAQESHLDMLSWLTKYVK
ncbi:carboxymethylenebutenolidase homolog [Phtheirospermum japonicum]|uniref:Carboxymethylenebutenolidase homolog n=1 Tax=Phtheirospermum japonicum TaxID=374723 RepID=A0A830CWZ5_9LAMI|nr:carboxymethylenebutenolidase homolog [Phtheirospermum japonicum]